jgi:hypothetical protein
VKLQRRDPGGSGFSWKTPNTEAQASNNKEGSIEEFRVVQENENGQ